MASFYDTVAMYCRLSSRGRVACRPRARAPQFVSSSAILIGTGDGAFNVMLNSLAVSFLLDLDSQMASSPCLIPKSFRGGAEAAAARADTDVPKPWSPVVADLARHPPFSQVGSRAKWSL